MVRHDPAVIEALVLAARSGQSGAHAALVELISPGFARTANALCGPLAADAVQDAWLGIVRALPRLHDPARFEAFAYRILANKCRDAIRRQRRDRIRLARASSRLHDRPMRPPPDGDDRATVRDAVSRLSDRQREVVVLFYAAELNIGTIASVLGVPRGTVKSRLHVARNELRDMLEPTNGPNNSTPIERNEQ